MARKIGGITGYVKNQPDGTVEIVAEGEDKQLQLFIKECRKGSFQSDVQDLEIKYEEPTGEFDGFYAEF
jgi:acylphosphatase